jgi:hypothetical protein
MDADVLPGPSLAELARTTVAGAYVATVTYRGAGGETTETAVIRGGLAGHPVILLAGGSAMTRLIRKWPAVTLSVPAPPPFRALALTGIARPGSPPREGPGFACRVLPTSLHFTGAGRVPVPLGQYLAAAPDPLWPAAARIIRHLERGHLADLLTCIRAHGMGQAEWVLPRRLDRFGLLLAVFTTDGIASVRLSFPDGPVTSFDQVPASLRAVLTCRCHEPDHEPTSDTGT